jgi:hypothetical protein
MPTNAQINAVRESLKRDPANLEIASRYWAALGSSNGHDLRSGRDVVETFGAAALSDSGGAGAFARAYRELFEMSGESPRAEFLGEELTEALKSALPQLSDQDQSTVRWILQSLGISS